MILYNTVQPSLARKALILKHNLHMLNYKLMKYEQVSAIFVWVGIWCWKRSTTHQQTLCTPVCFTEWWKHCRNNKVLPYIFSSHPSFKFYIDTQNSVGSLKTHHTNWSFSAFTECRKWSKLLNLSLQKINNNRDKRASLVWIASILVCDFTWIWTNNTIDSLFKGTEKQFLTFCCRKQNPTLTGGMLFLLLGCSIL